MDIENVIECIEKSTSNINVESFGRANKSWVGEKYDPFDFSKRDSIDHPDNEYNPFDFSGRESIATPSFKEPEMLPLHEVSFGKHGAELPAVEAIQEALLENIGLRLIRGDETIGSISISSDVGFVVDSSNFDDPSMIVDSIHVESRRLLEEPEAMKDLQERATEIYNSRGIDHDEQQPYSAPSTEISQTCSL